MKRSSRHDKAIHDVCRALWRGELTAVPSQAEFIARFVPTLAGSYQVIAPPGGVRCTKYGRPVDWGSKAAVKSQNTKRTNEADRIYAECVEIIKAELSRITESQS